MLWIDEYWLRGAWHSPPGALIWRSHLHPGDPPHRPKQFSSRRQRSTLERLKRLANSSTQTPPTGICPAKLSFKSSILVEIYQDIHMLVESSHRMSRRRIVYHHCKDQVCQSTHGKYLLDWPKFYYCVLI